MTGIEVLAPLRIETRFFAPDPQSPQWRLRLRLYPDAFSMRREPLPPTSTELDRLDEALAGPSQNPPIDEAAAFAALAAAVGAPRAVWLLRTVPRIDVDGVPHADPDVAIDGNPKALPETHKPDGLPPQLDVWFVVGATRTLAATLTLDRTKIHDDLDLLAFQDDAVLGEGKLPVVWWNSFARAREVGLATEIPLGAAVPNFEAIVVTGLGDTDPADLVAAHAASGRLAVLAQGTPTNTVHGEATTELGRDPRAWFPLVAADPAAQPATVALVRALTGSDPTMPLVGGDLDHDGAQYMLVGALWNVLFGRSMRDMTGAGAAERPLVEWARDNLAAQSVYPAMRVGDQPYGVLPATAMKRWAGAAGDPAIEASIAKWSVLWRKASADAAEDVGNVLDASTERFLALLGERAPTREWGVRPVSSLAIAQALRAMSGMPTVYATAWDDATASSLAHQPRPQHPLSPVGGLYPLPGDPIDRHDKPDILFEMLEADAEALLGREWRLGLLGHLLREALLLARARIGLAFQQLVGGNPIDPGAPLPIFGFEAEMLQLIFNGNDANLNTIAASGDARAAEVIDAFNDTRGAAKAVIDRWDREPDTVFATLLAVLDTAAFRVDPWITGVANRRLRALSAAHAPFKLGAYGWVDRPKPASIAVGALPPGPTPAGLLHAPSHAQALTAALLRDAAVRFPGDDRWNITIDSAKVREAIRLSERVRLGVHPYEALGLEVERLAGDWNVVRTLRNAFPMRTEHEGRRCCDGARVLRAVLQGAEPLPAGLPPNLATTLAPLADVLDTYGDLLVADGVHALVTGRGELANAAMEAAAGLGAPPELRAMKTPRSATTVRVSAWTLLSPSDEESTSPAIAVDPAFAKLVDDEIGKPSAWRWIVHTEDGNVAVTLAALGLHGVDLIGLASEAVDALVRGGLAPTSVVTSDGGAQRLSAATRLAELLGGGDDNPPIPDPQSGRDDAKALETPLRIAMRTDLTARLASLRDVAVDAVGLIDATDAEDPDEVAATLAALATWRLDARTLEAARAELQARIDAAVVAPTEVNALRRALRSLADAPRLPVLPIVPRAQLPALTRAADAADGHPETDSQWLEIVAAVRPRLALLEARQLDAKRAPWPAAVHVDGGPPNPWSKLGPVVVAYGPAVANVSANVAIASLDAWVDSIPSADHVTRAAFGFNGPKSRAPQAVLIGVPPDASHRITAEELRDVVLETRELVRARVAGPDRDGMRRIATPLPLVFMGSRLNFLDNWPNA